MFGWLIFIVLAVAAIIIYIDPFWKKAELIPVHLRHHDELSYSQLQHRLTMKEFGERYDHFTETGEEDGYVWYRYFCGKFSQYDQYVDFWFNPEEGSLNKTMLNFYHDGGLGETFSYDLSHSIWDCDIHFRVAQKELSPEIVGRTSERKPKPTPKMKRQ